MANVLVEYSWPLRCNVSHAEKFTNVNQWDMEFRASFRFNGPFYLRYFIFDLIQVGVNCFLVYTLSFQPEVCYENALLLVRIGFRQLSWRSILVKDNLTQIIAGWN